jgi:hypothetical protein
MQLSAQQRALLFVQCTVVYTTGLLHEVYRPETCNSTQLSFILLSAQQRALLFVQCTVVYTTGLLHEVYLPETCNSTQLSYILLSAQQRALLFVQCTVVYTTGLLHECTCPKPVTAPSYVSCCYLLNKGLCYLYRVLSSMPPVFLTRYRVYWCLVTQEFCGFEFGQM